MKTILRFFQNNFFLIIILFFIIGMGLGFLNNLNNNLVVYINPIVEVDYGFMEISAKETEKIYDYNKDYLIKRAIEWNTNQVYHDNSLSYPEHIAGEKEIEKRITNIKTYIEKHNNTKLKNREVFIDIYSIIEHETRWVNYLYLDQGTSFGVASMQYNTAKEFTNKQPYELQSDTTKQVELAVLYYLHMYRYYNDREMAILAYNRGFNINQAVGNYHYYREVSRIRREIKEDN